MLKWRPLLQQAQGEHRLRHRTPQQAGYPGPICLGQLSDWQDHLIYDSSQLQDLITQSKDVNPPPVPISLLAHCVQTFLPDTVKTAWHRFLHVHLIFFAEAAVGHQDLQGLLYLPGSGPQKSHH